MESIEFLRRLLDDVPASDNEDDIAGLFFDDPSLNEYLELAGGNIFGAAAYGWMDRAADYHSKIDREESGSRIKLSQLYDHANSQVKLYAGIAGISVSFDPATSLPRVHGVAVTLRERDPGTVTYYKSR